MIAESNAELDWIIIDQLEFDSIIGIYPHERAAMQPLRFDLRLGIASMLEAARRDNISATV
ncbi:MAG: hypothetical protein B7Z82_06150, partial [Halothiobacillus sp. 20-54-6]